MSMIFRIGWDRKFTIVFAIFSVVVSTAYADDTTYFDVVKRYADTMIEQEPRLPGSDSGRGLEIPRDLLFCSWRPSAM